MEIKTDFLVLGSGIAGLFYALKVAELGSVAIVTKKQKAESNTNYAQGGIASVLSSTDSFESHIADTMNAGAHLCHRDAVEVLVKEGPERVKELMHIGVEFTRQGNQLDLGKEGGHSQHRIAHAADLTGKEVERALLAKVAEHPNITIYENHISIDLITEHHLFEHAKKQHSEIHCWGAYVLDVDNNVVKTFLAPVTMLSTGGAGHVYLHTTNPSIATGDGIAMAFRAGTAIGNLEFIQFHPTALYNSGSPEFLISEAVRGFGGILRTTAGEDFMPKYDKRGSLATRDIVARAIDSELKKSGAEHVYLDVTHLDADAVKNHFPNIYKRCLEFKLDITKELIPVVPAAHFVCGGVVTDLHGRTSISGLYACGEVSMTGVHGANRLASNSLLEAIVYSHRAAEDIRHRRSPKEAIPDIPAWDDSEQSTAKNGSSFLMTAVKFNKPCGIMSASFDQRPRLERAQRRIQLILKEVNDFYRRTKVTEGLIELRNLACVADIIIRSALMRHESRGLHFTTDYPKLDDEHCLNDTIITSDITNEKTATR